MAAHLRQAAKQLGKTVAELLGKDPALGDEPLPPEELAPLWRVYLELDAARQGTGYGPQPLGYMEMAAYAVLTCTPVAPWEIRVLKRLDAAYLQEWHANARSRRA